MEWVLGSYTCQSYTYHSYTCQSHTCQSYTCQSYICQSYACQSYTCHSYTRYNALEIHSCADKIFFVLYLCTKHEASDWRAAQLGPALTHCAAIVVQDKPEFARALAHRGTYPEFK